ncbi:Bacterial regulatory proteins, tetR family [Acididesulfobacillus acetoxydans]|uniref:Bacterial regulatory proteins, tetR family n=1 Tax=Acididesulfobacillus acetoxydans TaxID=1561005 RepID=A0A8S0X5G6_9FIRM|nr:Bacterial regulatory proteins, tetR family [Acididesulfobacillus acetoxydans]CEJ07117.1 Fatty acid metabolism regulator protein [Acididesulfobacillus acetoxydans]
MILTAQREDKFRRILDAAVEAFAEVGYHQCQVSKIARLAGVADGTIYLYFKNKEDILIRLFQERMGDFIRDIRNLLQGRETTRARLMTIIETHFRNMEENLSLAKVTQLELRQSDLKIRTAINAPLKEYFRLIEEVIRSGIERGELAPVDVRIARQLIFGALDEATTDWIMARTKRSLLSESEEMLYLFEGALGLAREPRPRAGRGANPQRTADVSGKMNAGEGARA